MNWQDPNHHPTPADLEPEDWDDGIDDRDDLDDGRDTDPSPLPPWQIHDQEPWGRQHREPQNAFEAFVVYRDLGGQRSLSTVVKRGQGEGDTKARRGWTRSNVNRWSSRWRWVERCRLWDDRQHRIQVDEFDATTRTMARRHSELARLLLRGAYGRLLGMPASEDGARAAVEPLNLNELTPLDVARFARYGVQIEAAAMTGMAPSRAEQLADAALAAAAHATDGGADEELAVMRAELMAMLQDRPVDAVVESNGSNGHDA